MKHFILIILIVLLIGCATVPQKADLLVRYPVKGEIVSVYHGKNIEPTQYFIMSYEDLMEFLDKVQHTDKKIRTKTLFNINQHIV